MPKKSRRNKILQSKRKKLRQQASPTPTQPPVVTRPAKPVASTPPASRPAPKVVAKTLPYPYVTAELKRIGILAGITLVILIVLALVLA